MSRARIQSSSSSVRKNEQLVSGSCPGDVLGCPLLFLTAWSFCGPIGSFLEWQE